MMQVMRMLSILYLVELSVKNSNLMLLDVSEDHTNQRHQEQEPFQRIWVGFDGKFYGDPGSTH